MSSQDRPLPPVPSAAPHLIDVPGAFPEPSQFSEDANFASDLSSLSRAVKARRAEYIGRKTIRVRIGTWNVAALPGTEDDIGKWFTKPSTTARQTHTRADSVGGDEQESQATGKKEPTDDASFGSNISGDVDIYVLGLQEIVDITAPSEALRPYVDHAPSNKWKEAVKEALPPGYELVSSQQLMGLLLLVYASPSAAPIISSVSSSSVGTGFMGYVGNKGAIATRIILGGTTRMVFLNCHLAAGADKGSFERRNWDTSQILLRTKFDPVDEEDDIADESSLMLGQEDFAFWFGDLNYRLDGIPGDDVRRLLHLHTENAYDFSLKSPNADKENIRPSSSTSDCNEPQRLTDSDTLSGKLDHNIALEDNDTELELDPASLKATITSLLPHDQLLSVRKRGILFHDGWREGPIDFLPSYKYDVGRIGRFDSSEKQRSPSWCDRILYRTGADYIEYLRRLKGEEEAKKRDEEMKSLGLEQEAEDDGILFDYDPESDGAQDAGDYYDENEDGAAEMALAPGDQGSEDAVNLLCYTSHQDIVSSDHKPLHADFILTYDCVIPQLKAKVHREVVRELDRAENEARPDITIVVDRPLRTTVAGNDSNVASDPDTVNFGEVRYDVPLSRTLTLANTGGVPATLCFRYRPGAAEEEDKSNSVSVSPPWLSVRVDWAQSEGGGYILQPGDSAQVQLVLCVHDMEFVRSLNRKETTIEDILVLRVTNGRDHFISVRGTWLPTCFGFSLLELAQVPEGGVRQFGGGGLPGSNGVGNGGGDSVTPRMSAPRELFRLTEAIAELTERSIAEWDMVGDSLDRKESPWMSERLGWPFDRETWVYQQNNERYKMLSSVREALDTNTPFTSHFPPELPALFRVELLSETLLWFLRSLEDGLVTLLLWKEIEQQMLVHEKSKRTLTADQCQSWILEILSSSPVHSVSFTFLTFMLNRVANEIAPVPPLPPPAPAATNKFQPQSPTTSATPSSIPTSPTFAFPFRFKSRSRASTNSESELFQPLSPSLTPPIHLPQTPTSAPPPETAPPPPPPPPPPPGKPTPTLLRRRAVNGSFARTFADAVFSSKIVAPEKDKERRAWEERRCRVLEPFLDLENQK